MKKEALGAEVSNTSSCEYIIKKDQWLSLSVCMSALEGAGLASYSLQEIGSV